METVNVELPVNRDFKEVVDLIDAIIEKVKTKAPIAEYAELIGKVTVAADGFKNVMEAVKTNNRDECVAYLIRTLMQRLMPVNEIENVVE